MTFVKKILLRKEPRFTQRAKRCVDLAIEETIKLGHSYTKPEHLLLGLLREDGGIAYAVLTKLGFQIESVQQLASQSPNEKLKEKPYLSSDGKQALKRARNEARQMKKLYIGTEHLLLGVIETKTTTLQNILDQNKVTKADIRREVMSILEAYEASVKKTATTIQPNAVARLKQALIRLRHMILKR